MQFRREVLLRVPERTGPQVKETGRGHQSQSERTRESGGANASIASSAATTTTSSKLARCQ